MTTYHQNMGKQAPYGMTGTVHTRIPGGGIPMSKDKDAEREAYQRGARDFAEAVRTMSREVKSPSTVQAYFVAFSAIARQLDVGEWPKGGADGQD